MSNSAANVISAYSTLTIAVLTLLYVVVTFCTLRKIGKQVESAEDAAKAALLNAQAVINAERAWILAEVEFSPGSGRLVHSAIPSEDGQQFGTTAAIRLTCRNHGRTPGWISEIMGRIEIATGLPETPNLENAESIFQGYMPLGSGQPFQRDHALTLSQTDTESGRPFEQRTLVYGVVIYTDAVTGERRETFWGYIIRDSRRIERLVDYPAYNRST